jgi:putative hemolysin
MRATTLSWPWLAALLALPMEASQACESMPYKTNTGQVHPVCYLKQHNAFLSASCAKRPCQAVGMLKKPRSLSIPVEELNQSYNPGYLYCVKAGGNVIIMRNQSDSEAAFCVAKDQSRVDLSSMSLK